MMGTRSWRPYKNKIACLSTAKLQLPVEGLLELLLIYCVLNF